MLVEGKITIQFKIKLEIHVSILETYFVNLFTVTVCMSYILHYVLIF